MIRSYSLAPGETLALEDVILSEFGLTRSLGALRITSNQAVVVNAISLNIANDTEYGQGVEAIPAAHATAAGSSTHVVGLINNDDFRTNITLLDASGQGSRATVDVIDPTGTVIGSGNYELRAFEPVHESVAELDAPPFENATLRVTVHSGAIITGASRVHGNVTPGSGDPITLNPWWRVQASDSTPDGVYDFAVYDTAGFASGGNLEIRNSRITSIYGTYFNWDKTNVTGDSVCTLIFPWGEELSPSIPVSDFALGVDFETSLSGPEEMIFTVRLDLNAISSFTGTVTAVGTGFSGTESGCNGTFPALEVSGGKNPQ